jgi:hypothetical protein
MKRPAVRLLLVALMVAGAVSLGCGDDDDDDGGEPPTAAAGGAGQEVRPGVAAVTGPSFDPNSLSVEAGKEFSIDFKNLDTIDHTFTIEDGPDSGPVAPGQLVTIPMEAGESGEKLIFFCTIHGLGVMGGQIEFE